MRTCVHTPKYYHIECITSCDLYCYRFVKQDLDEEKKQRYLLETKHQRLGNSLTEVKGQVQLGDYKIENYDKVKRFRVLSYVWVGSVYFK